MRANLSLLIIFLGVTARASTSGYDEAYGPHGAERPAYRAFRERFGVDVLNPSDKLVDHMLDRPLNDELKGAPVPLILSTREIEHLRRGAAQRARVFEELYYDLVMADQRAFAALGPDFQAIVTDAFRSQGFSLEFLRAIFRGQPKSKVRFLYGPDLMRHRGGRWVVIEDGMGPQMGGLADADAMRDVLAKQLGIDYPRSDVMDDLIESFYDDPGLGPRRQLLALLDDVQRGDPDHVDDEHWRLLSVLTSRVHVLMLVTDHENTTYADLENHALVLLENCGRMSPRESVNLCRGFARGEVELFGSPGVEALGDKRILPFVNRLARLYLGERLILRSPPTHLLRASADLGRVYRRYRNNVVLKIDTAEGGSGISFGNRMNEEQMDGFEELLDHTAAVSMLANGVALPSHVAQPNLAPSFLPTGPGRRSTRMKLHLRPFVYVGPTRITPAQTIYGRGSTGYGNQRQNVSLGGQTVVVLSPCEDLLESDG